MDFREHGWDIKRLIRMMVISEAYGRARRDRGDEADRSANRLLARGPRYRLDAEVLRDQALSLSGLFVDRQGGPSVKPPQPDGLWAAVGYSGSNTVRFTPETGERFIVAVSTRFGNEPVRRPKCRPLMRRVANRARRDENAPIHRCKPCC